jgi:hypothetical protein
MQRNRGFVSSRVSTWNGTMPLQRVRLSPPIEYLVIGGGGGGGQGWNNGAGGGGAGGYLASQVTTYSLGTDYNVTVGAGGAGSTN